MNRLRTEFVKLLFGIKERNELYSVMLAYVKDDVSLLPLLEGRYSRLSKKKDEMALIYGDVIKKTKAGQSIAMAFQDWIPAAEFAILRGASESGKLKLGLESLVNQTLNMIEVKSVFTKALTLPIIMLMVTLVMILGMSTFLVPNILMELDGAVKGGIDFIGFPKIVISTSHFISQFLIPIVTILISLIILVFISLPRWSSPLRRFVEKLPPYNIYKLHTSTSFLIYIGAMINADRPLISALNGIRDTSTPYVKRFVLKMIKSLNDGRLSQMQAMDVGLIDQDTVDLLQDFSKTKSFDGAIISVGKNSLEATLKRAQTIAMRLNLLVVLIMLISALFFIGGIFAIVLTARSAMG